MYVSLPDGVVFSIAGSKTSSYKLNRTRISQLLGKDKGRVATENKISNPNSLNVSVDTEVLEPNEERQSSLLSFGLEMRWFYLLPDMSLSNNASDSEPQKTF